MASKLFYANCFRFKSPPLLGTIKHLSEDFEVHEINNDGNIAGSYASSITPTLYGFPKSRKKKSLDSSVKKTIQENNLWKTVAENPFYLKETVGDEIHAKIMSIDPLNDQLDLKIGSFDDKFHRATIYETMRFEFPYILLTTCKAHDEVTMVASIDNNWIEFYNNVFDKEIVNAIFQYIYCRTVMNNNENNLTSLEVAVNSYDKIMRKTLHQLISKHFGKLIESKTICKDNKNFIALRYKEKKTCQKRKLSGDCIILHFTLFKRNLELLTVLQKVAIELKIQLSSIKYAGIKDKKADTYQFISIIGENLLEKVEGIEKLPFNSWKLSLPVLKNKELQIGHLKGNLFKIVIREVTSVLQSDELSTVQIFRESASNICKYGFFNYFGPQRFGEELVTAQIGLCLLRKEYMKAVDLLLSPKKEKSPLDELDEDAVEQSKTVFFNHKDIKTALKIMPFHRSRERLVLQALNRYSYSEEGALKAFLNLPHAIRLFYIHSYCSLIWNKVLSERITTYGLEVFPGDLVMNNQSQQLEYVTETDVKNKRFTLENISFPLAGVSSKLPENETKNIYKRLLEADCVSLADFRLKELGFNVPGAYRVAVVKPEEFEILSISSEAGKDDIADVTVQFVLPSSSYATMLIRELLHSS